MTELTLFGLKNCDSCRKARRWLDDNGVAYRFHDVRDDGLDAARLGLWAERVDWETLVNRKSTTWRGLPENTRASMDRRSAVATMAEHPTLLKRPVLERDDLLEIGFSPDRYASLLGG